MNFLPKLALAILLPCCQGCGRPPTQRALIFSAASDLQDFLLANQKTLESAAGCPIEYQFGASAVLLRQIEAGAKVDLFASANVEFVDRLIKQNLADARTRHLYAQGRLVAVVRPDGEKLSNIQDLLKPEIRKIALANPETAPYGAAAKQCFESAGLFEQLKPKLVYADNVRQALQYADAGNVDVAMVSASLVKGRTVSVWRVPRSLHNPIVQAMVVVTGSPTHPSATALVAFFNSSNGQQKLADFGFELPPTSTAITDEEPP